MKIVLFANTDWYLYNFRLSLAGALRDAGYEVLLVSPPGQYGPLLEDKGFRWQPIPMQRRSLNPLREFGLLLHLRRLLRTEKPDLVHSFTIKSAVYGSLAARAAGIERRVNAVAGMGYVFISNDLKARLLRPVVRSLMRLALSGRGSRLILQNKDDVELFRKSGVVDPSRIRLVRGSGVDCNMFTPPPLPRSAQNRPFRVLLAARLLWDKGIKEYVEAARQLSNRAQRFEFLLAGDPDPGNPAAVPEQRVTEWQSEGLVSWLGHVDDMRQLYRTVDLVVLPSYREGLPKSLIEAAACGLPVVTTDVPGCREVVVNEESGLVVPARDATALAAAVARIADDSELAARLGRGARDQARQHFDIGIIVGQTLAVYGELLGPLSDPAH